MATNNENTPTSLENVESVLTRTEQFIEKNQKTLTYIAIGILVIVGGFIGFKKLVLAPREKDAQAQMYMAEQYFGVDSFNLALNGDGNNIGFLDVVDNFGMTKSANLAHFYSGICLLNLSDYEGAIEHLKKFSTKDEFLAPMKYGAMGDAYAQLNDMEEALNFYKKAIKTKPNEFTTPMYIMKAGLLCEELKDYPAALELYKGLKKDFPKTIEASQVDKYIARVEVLVK